MAKAAGRKQTKKFVQGGHLARTIKDRKRKQDVKKKIENRRALRGKGGQGGQQQGQGDDDDDDGDVAQGAHAEQDGQPDLSGDEMLDDDTLQALLGDDDAAELDDGEEDDEDSLAGLEGEEEKHKLDIAELKEKDPEFYKYLQENDKALLDFGGDAEDDVDESDVEEDSKAAKKSKKGKSKAAEPKKTVVTKELLKSWQKLMLQQRSLKALRKVLLCFRVAARSQADDEDDRKPSTAPAEQFAIPNAVIFNKVIVAALKFTPLVLNYHVPAKEMPNGRYKINTQSKKYATAQRIVKSYFTSLQSLISTLSSNNELLHLAISDSSRLVPYLVGNRKVSKSYLRSILEYWTTAHDDAVRLAAFLALRKLAVCGDASLTELVLKGSYLAIQQSSKNTTAYSLPSINLMKNTASTLYLPLGGGQNEHQAYQIGFRYIRQLAITLRNCMKIQPRGGKDGGKKDKDKFRQVYNWTFVHSIDFWSLVLATACDKAKETENGKESELRPLIYPLVQITLGVIRLVPTSRYYPIRFQLIASLLRIVQRTGTYIPLAPYLLEIFESSELSRKPKGSSLKPLDWTYYIKAPTSYPHTRVYADSLVDETTYYLLEFLATQSTSIAFPELSIPIIVSLRKHIKKTKNAKLGGALKTLVERVESNATWIEEQRSKVEFSPQDREQVDAFLFGEESSPLKTYLKLQRKTREQKRELLEKSLADGDDDDEAEDDEIMDEDDE